MGRKSRQLRRDNQAKVFYRIAEKPLTFSELLQETQLSRATLSQHLKLLQREGLVYKSVIDPTQPLDSKKISKVVYRVKEDEMREYLVRTMQMNFSFLGLVEDTVLREKLTHHVKEIAHAIADYLNKLQVTRQRRLESELKRVR